MANGFFPLQHPVRIPFLPNLQIILVVGHLLLEGGKGGWGGWRCWFRGLLRFGLIKGWGVVATNPREVAGLKELGTRATTAFGGWVSLGFVQQGSKATSLPTFVIVTKASKGHLVKVKTFMTWPIGFIWEGAIIPPPNVTWGIIKRINNRGAIAVLGDSADTNSPIIMPLKEAKNIVSHNCT